MRNANPPQQNVIALKFVRDSKSVVQMQLSTSHVGDFNCFYELYEITPGMV